MSALSSRSPEPTFLIIGTMKAGSSALYHYVDQHPEIFMSAVKEPTFFIDPDIRALRQSKSALRNNPWATTAEDYYALFSKGGGYQARGEASILYLYYENSPALIKQAHPDIKLIAVLREPVSRAYSHFMMTRRLGYEPVSDFETAFHLSEQRAAEGWAPHVYGYHELGLYAQQVKRYLELFARDQLRFYLHEDLHNSPAEVLKDIFAFLDVDPTFEGDYTRTYLPGRVPRRGLSRLTGERDSLVYKALHSDSGLKRILRGIVRPLLPQHLHGNLGLHLFFAPKPALDPTVRTRLAQEYQADIRELETLIERDLSAWLKP